MSRLHNPTVQHINSFNPNAPPSIQPPNNYDHETIADPDSPIIIPPEAIPQNFSNYETPPYEVLNFKGYFQSRFDSGTTPIFAQGSYVPNVIEQSRNGETLFFHTARRGLFPPNGPPASPTESMDQGFCDFHSSPNRDTETVIETMKDLKGTMSFFMRQAFHPQIIQIKSLIAGSGEQIFRFAKRTITNKIQVSAVLPPSYGTWSQCCQKNELAFIFAESYLCEPRLSGAEITAIVNAYNHNISEIRNVYSDIQQIPSKVIFDMGKLLRAILLQEYALCEHRDRYTSHICGSSHGLENLTRNKVNLSAFPHSVPEAAEFLDRHKTFRCYPFKEAFQNIHILPLHIPLMNTSTIRKYGCKTSCNYFYNHSEVLEGTKNNDCVTANVTGLCLHFTIHSFYQYHKNIFHSLTRAIKDRNIGNFSELVTFLDQLHSEASSNNFTDPEDLTQMGISQLMPLFLPRELFLYGLMQQNSTPCFTTLENKFEREHEKQSAKRNIFQRNPIYLDSPKCADCKRCKHNMQLSCCADRKKMHFVKIKPIFRKCTVCRASQNAGQRERGQNSSPPEKPLVDRISFFIFNRHCETNISTFCLLLEKISNCYCTIYKTEHRIFSVYLTICYYYYPLLGKDLEDRICQRAPLFKTMYLLADIFTLSHQLAHELLIANLELKVQFSEFANFKANEVYARRAWEFEITKQVFFEFLSTLNIGSLYLCTNRLVTYNFNLNEKIQTVCNRKFAKLCKSIIDSSDFRNYNDELPDLSELENSKMTSLQFDEYCNSVSAELEKIVPQELLCDRFDQISQYSICSPHFLLNMKLFLAKKMGMHFPNLTEIEELCKIESLQFFVLMNVSKFSILSHSQCNYDIKKSNYLHLYQHYLSRFKFLNIYNLFVEKNIDEAVAKMKKLADCLTSEEAVGKAAEAILLMASMDDLAQCVSHVHTFVDVNPN